jgi:hypothetical protein
MNPFAKEFVPVRGVEDTKTGSRAIPIKASFTRPAAMQLTSSPVKGEDHPTPRGSADMGKYVSCDLTFDDCFDHGSRQNSVRRRGLRHACAASGYA